MQLTLQSFCKAMYILRLETWLMYSMDMHVCVCELPIEGLVVQGQPVVIWCSVFLLAAVAAVTI